MNEPIDLQRFYNLMADSDIEFDLQKQFLAMAQTMNELREEVVAKRYALMVSDE